MPEGEAVENLTEATPVANRAARRSTTRKTPARRRKPPMFKYEATIDDKPVTLEFKNWGDAPGRISRRNIGDVEAQVWGYLEWGLTSPANWPVDSKKPGHAIFDELSQRQITECYSQWQRADG